MGRPELHDLMKELRAILDEYDGDRMLVGGDDDIAYMGSGEDELHPGLQLPLMRVERMTPAHIRRNQRERLARLIPARARLAVQHAGQPRYLARLLPATVMVSTMCREARLNAALVLTLRGTPFSTTAKNRNAGLHHHRPRETARYDGDLVLPGAGQRPEGGPRRKPPCARAR